MALSVKSTDYHRCAYIAVLMALFSAMAQANDRWCPRRCECYHEFETVDCSRRSLTVLPQASALTKRIYAENNNIAVLDGSNTHNLTQLLVLNIPNNNLSSLASQAFCGMPRVMEINLTQNQIGSFHVGPSPRCQLRHLQILRLEFNRLHTIPQNLSLLAPNLRLLYLGYNEIHSATFDLTYSQFLLLESIDLRGNPIHEIGSHDLEPLASLSLGALNFHDCAMTHIHEHALSQLSNITSLILSKNSLELSQLEKAFRNMGNGSRLSQLDISEMVFTRINNSHLCMFRDLTILDISYSSISYIEPELFNSLSNLEVLNIEGNFLKSLEGIQNLSNVKKIFLKDNKLKEIHLEYLKEVEIIDLSKNELAQLPPEWLSSVGHIGLLNVSNNRLSVISHGALQRADIHTLDVSHNRLERLHRYGAARIQNLYAAHNKLTEVTDSAFDNLEPCLQELDLSFNYFADFPMLIRREFTALQRLSLAHNRLGDSITKGELGNLFQSLGHLQVLDLSFNQIRSIPRGQIGNLHHLTTLQLQANSIKRLEDLGIGQLKSLAKLVLANNLIRTVNGFALEKMPYLEILDLSRNPYQCTCHLLPFQTWLNRTFVRIVNLEDTTAYQCASPELFRGRNILSVHPDMTNCLKHNRSSLSKLKLEVIAISFVTVLLLGACISALCYYCKFCAQVRTLRYKWQVRYREVSVQGAECAVDQCGDCDDYAFDEIEVDDTKGLTLSNKYAQDPE